jgi:hypothetical protein
VPSRDGGIADVELLVCAVGPEVIRARAEVGRKIPPPVSIAASRVKPNLKLCAPFSSVALPADSHAADVV